MLKAFCAITCALLFVTTNLFAQTSTSGTVVGTVTDPSGAVTPNAEVQLLNVETNAAVSQKTNDSGGFSFPNVAPGSYRVTVKMSGFRAATVDGLQVEVNKSLSVPVQLQVGRETEVIEVTAAVAAQLQTQDSVIGDTVSTNAILRLPSLQRNATELMGLQPATASTGGNGLMMRSAGAVDDQNTVTVDGIDITQGVVAAATAI